NPLPGDDFAVYTGAPVVLALGRPHAVPEDASDPQVDGDEGGCESFRAPPLLHLTRVREGFPHAFGRCVEDPRDDELVLLSTTSRLLFLRPRVALLRFLHQFGEALDRLAGPFLHPGGEHPLEVLDRREDGPLRDLRLAPDLLEHGALDEDMSRHPLEFEGFDDSFERHDFPVFPVETELVPLGVPLDESPGPARSDVHLLHDRGVFQIGAKTDLCVTFVLPRISSNTALSTRTCPGIPSNSKVSTIRSKGTTSRYSPWKPNSFPSASRWTNRQVPPGRTSIFSTTVVYFLGPHQRGISFGFVHAFHTSSRGASKTCVLTSSRFDVLSGLPIVGMFSFLLSFFLAGFLQVFGQSSETVLPQDAVARQPTERRAER